MSDDLYFHTPPGDSCQWESSSEDLLSQNEPKDDVAKGSGELNVGSGPPDPSASFMG